MATSQIRAINIQTGRQVVVLDAKGRYRWAAGIFDNNPRIARQMRRDTAVLRNGPGLRPYIESRIAGRWTWREWNIAPGEIHFDAAELRHIHGMRSDAIVIEPHTKDGKRVNKAWPWERWQAVVLSGIAEFVQVGPPGTRRLKGVTFRETPTFRDAMLVMAASRGYVGTEGGLHHAAAAMGVPAVVLWSHFIAPQFTGYTMQTNIRHATGYCGLEVPCAECAASMAAIHVDEVMDAIGGIR